jgi:hypothetical protein
MYIMVRYKLRIRQLHPSTCTYTFVYVIQLSIDICTAKEYQIYKQLIVSPIKYRLFGTDPTRKHFSNALIIHTLLIFMKSCYLLIVQSWSLDY